MDEREVSARVQQAAPLGERLAQLRLDPALESCRAAGVRVAEEVVERVAEVALVPCDLQDLG